MSSDDHCLSNNNSNAAGFMLLTLSVVTLATTLTIATMFSGSPLDQLGIRPKGTNLWSWLYNYLKESSTVGIQGYDAIQGALSPPLRLLAHIAGTIFLWGVIVLVSDNLFDEGGGGIGDSSSSSCDDGDGSSSFWMTGVVASSLYLAIFGFLQYGLPGVSAPGGPRAHRIQRQPKWDDKTITIDPNITAKWKCLVAQESHQDTWQKFATAEEEQELTGEPAGRQIWSIPVPTEGTNNSNERRQSSSSSTDVVSRLLNHAFGGGGGGNPDSSSNNNSGVDEDLVQEMARGGRDYSGFNASKNPNSCDMIFRAQQIRKYLSKEGNKPFPDSSTTEEEGSKHRHTKTVKETLRKAVHFYSMLQCDDGHWAADYGGPHFLMPGMITAWYCMGKPTNFLNDEQIELLKHYILVHQQSDGGWGTHIESPSTMFGSTLMYVALRLLGIDKDHPAAIRGRNFIQGNGGALYASSWSKFYLCLLGCMDWRGHNSVPPEMWLLPNWFPFHPGRMWCHARMVYLPMGYLYGNRYVYEHAESDDVILGLREELYCEAYNTIPWTKTRHWIADMDNYSPIPWVMKTLQNVLVIYENLPLFQPLKNYIRKRGLEFSFNYIQAEDLQTNYIDIGPVNKIMNMLSNYHASGGDLKNPKVVSHLMRVQDYLWVAEDGMKMQGYNGSQCWDTSFCAQAIYEAGLLDEFPEVSQKIWGYLERTQILSTEVSQSSPAYKYETNEYRNKFYRHISEGGWPFSTSAHGWPISDCTSEGLKGVLCLLHSTAVKEGLEDGSLKQIEDERLFKAVNVLLTYQNEDGGWATYENNRGWGWYEQLNPSEVFGDIMIDYSYVECSMACLTALADFQKFYPDHRVEDIKHSIDKGRAFLKSIQRDDGSWYGSWACCFCYGIWFGVEGLVKCGEPLESPNILSACKYLLQQQRPNGGWGEDFTSCYDKFYAQEGMKAYGDDGSGVVNTSWALLSLSIANCKDVDAIRRGVKYLMKRQLPSGDWPQEGISGVFNRSVGITYTSYRNVFPIWALGRCSGVYGEEIFNDE